MMRFLPNFLVVIFCTLANISCSSIMHSRSRISNVDTGQSKVSIKQYNKLISQKCSKKNKIEIASKHNEVFAKDPSKPTIKIYAPDPDYQLKIALDIIRENYNIEYVDIDYDLVMSSCLDKKPLSTPSNVVKIYYTGEVYIGDPKKYLDTYDLVMGFDFIERDNYIRFPYAYKHLENKMRHNFDRNKGSCKPKEKKHFACFLASNGGEWHKGFDGAEARNHLFHKLSLYKKVVSGGKYLNNIGGSVPYGETDEWLSGCKFTIAYENQLDYPGYITEKPFQAWFAGTVPIYNAHPAGLPDLNKNALIYAQDFANEDSLVEYIKKLDNDDKLYCETWNQRILTDPEKDFELLKQKIREKLNLIFKEKLKKELL